MINFFRKIRHKLADQNQFLKYSRYAVGEIALVVIGILIALQINNWNNERINKNKEHMLLMEMSDELELDVKELQMKIKAYKGWIKASQMVLNHLNMETLDNDSLGFYYNNLTGYLIFNSNTSTFENLKSIGFDLISSDSLRRQITSLYSKDYPLIKHSTGIWDSNIQINLFYPQFTAHIVTNPNGTAKPVNMEVLKNNNQFKEMLKLNIDVKKLSIYTKEKTLESIISLQKNINRELQKE